MAAFGTKNVHSACAQCPPKNKLITPILYTIETYILYLLSSKFGQQHCIIATDMIFIDSSTIDKNLPTKERHVNQVFNGFLAWVFTK